MLDTAEVVGREAELAAALGLLDRAEELPRALVIEGAAGIGKTTIWRRALVEAERFGYLVLACNPSGSETELGFAGLRDLLGGVYADAAADLPNPQRRALDIALLRAHVGDEPPERGAAAAGLLGALRWLAKRRPLVVAVDDLQWLDQSSAATLEFALRRLTREPVAVLFTKRQGAKGTTLDLARGGLSDRREHVYVGGLSLGALHRLLQDRLTMRLSRPTLRRVHELSGGNPFFALEVGRALERRGGHIAAGEALPVPSELQDLVRDRLEALPARTLEVVQLAAALARPTIEVLAAATESDLAAVDPAVEANVLEIESGWLRFTHPLLASTAYSMLAPARRRNVHERLAGSIVDPEERARHLAIATREPAEAIAATLDSAADQARARGARAAAAELLEHAARLTPPVYATEQRRRTRDAAYLHFESGDSQRGRAMLEELVAELPAGPERAGVLIRIAMTRAYDDDLHAATDLFLQAEQEADENHRLRAEALNNVASMLFRRRERLSEAVEYAKTAVALAREAGDRTLLADALGQQILSEATLGRPEARRTVDEAMALQPENEEARLLSQPKWIAAIARMWWEELDWAHQAYVELLERGRSSGEDALVPYVYILAAQNECLRGHFASATAYAEMGRELAEQAGEETLTSYALALEAYADVHRGNAQARDAATSALEVGRRTHGTPTVFFAAAALGLLDLSLGRPNDAAKWLGEIVTFARSEEIAEPGLTRFTVDYIESLIELGDLAAAEELIDWYESNAVRLGRNGALASALRCRGLLAAARGDLDGALSVLEQSLTAHEASLLPFDRARTLLVHGATLRRAKQKRLAREALGTAKGEFERLGAQVWATRTEAELARVSGRRGSEGELTPTERRIAELVAEGRSTKAVASALFVSPKTVEGHLSKIYAKLGIRSRAELARTLPFTPTSS